MESFNVLLVDDERDFVDLLAKSLRNRELTVECAFNGVEALEILRERSFDVVVLDVKMPGMDGIETLREIKKLKPDTEVIMLTGHATIDSAVESLKSDAFDYLVKPVEIEILVEKLKEACNKKFISGAPGPWPPYTP